MYERHNLVAPALEGICRCQVDTTDASAVVSGHHRYQLSHIGINHLTAATCLLSEIVTSINVAGQLISD